MELGILKSVSPREKWNSEARDFTPWLADNIEELNKTLGLELKVEETEVDAGSYSADILAIDLTTGKYVIIENQLDKTNHDHLGKSITYASVLDVSLIIWIATDFAEEHKKALDWLNDHTNDEISFYGVQIELWQIDDSKPASKFNIVSKPNQAVRDALRLKIESSLPKNKRFQLEFWTKFKDKLYQSKKFSLLPTPKPQYWYDISLVKTFINLYTTCNTKDNIVRIGINIDTKIVDELFPLLESQKHEIEKAMGESLIWDPNSSQTSGKMIVLIHSTDFNDPQKVEEALDWLVERAIKFKEAFSHFTKRKSKH